MPGATTDGIPEKELARSGRSVGWNGPEVCRKRKGEFRESGVSALPTIGWLKNVQNAARATVRVPPNGRHARPRRGPKLFLSVADSRRPRSGRGRELRPVGLLLSM